MVSSSASTVDQYLAELPDDRRDAISQVRDTILANLAPGFVETINWGMISYEVPLETYPDTYNKKPLLFAALASQKRHMAVYLHAVFGDPELEDWFRERYIESGCKLDMGKSCVRFKTLDQLPLDVLGEAVAKVTLDDFIGMSR